MSKKSVKNRKISVQKIKLVWGEKIVAAANIYILLPQFTCQIFLIVNGPSFEIGILFVKIFLPPFFFQHSFKNGLYSAD